jgi:hypothetical protein
MSDEPPSSNYKTPEQLRAQAHRARELANGLLPSDETARRLRQLADELEAEADALDRQSSP